MNNQQLLSSFRSAINWNVLLYTSYKILSTMLSYRLYSHLSTELFSVWATINSTAFLLLLWLDCGLRKSIPRYSPEFSRLPGVGQKFTRTIFTFQCLVLTAALPLFYWLTSKGMLRLGITDFNLVLLGSGIFVTEGIVTVIRLLYHAHFWHKYFNSIATLVMLAEMMGALTSIAYYTEHQLLMVIFSLKIITNILIITYSYSSLKKLNPDMPIASVEQGASLTLTTHNFIKHSLIMWVSNILKSISERNFLVPFITYSINPVAGNMFKVANDGALLLYRIVIKTIGTTDTTLLAHVETSHENRNLMPIAFTTLTTQVAALSIPLLGIVGVVFLISADCVYDSFVFQLFLIMSTSYLIETLFLPYERILEVKRNYAYLFLSYIPYLLIMIPFIHGSIITWIGLVWSIALVHGVRLVSLALMVGCAHMHYTVPFPFRIVTLITLLCASGAGAFSLLVPRTCLTWLLAHIPALNAIFIK